MGIAQSACAQSGRNQLPLIDIPVSWSDWLTSPPSNPSLRIVLSLSSGLPSWRDVWLTPPSHLTLLSGPEGGLTPEEEAQALSMGFKAVSLGPMTLRAETAAIVVLAQLL
jgi:16S rRNA (uracil1498-N3)-methyltransferase